MRKQTFLYTLMLTACAPMAFAASVTPTPPSGAGTCDSPYAMQSNTSYTVDTCGGPAGIPMGGATLPHQSVIFSFTYHADADAPNPNQITVSGTNMNVVLGPDCESFPVGGAAEGIPFDLTTLTEGQTYVAIVTTDPSVAVPDDGPLCSSATTATTGALPVELSKFSVD